MEEELNPSFIQSFSTSIVLYRTSTHDTLMYTNDGRNPSYLTATVQKIDELVNQDVEMQAPLSERAVCMVIDTNILLHHLDVLQRFITDLERLSLPVAAVIPGIVVRELDSQKNREGLAWASRRASAWILNKLRERKDSIRVQANEETCKTSGQWKSGHGGSMVNDDLIIDCAQFLGRCHRTGLLSADKNLCVLAEAAGVSSISPPARQWSSRELARCIFGDDLITRQFEDAIGLPGETTQLKLKPKSKSKALAMVVMDNDDSMDIDEDPLVDVKDHLPSHPLDLLHMQVVEHFTQLLRDLVESQRSSNDDHDSEVSQSIHAVRLPAGPVSWDATKCIAFLDAQKHRRRSYPELSVFLRQRHSGAGARLGQAWPQQAWQTALGALNDLATVWKDDVIGDSLQVLRPEVINVFSQKMKPTGT